ncbi:MAG: FAD-binding oxidoreductase, partial [Mesorhizobium sp.]
ARRFWRSYDDSIDMIEAIIAEEAIDCSFRRGGKLKLASKPSHVKGLQAMCEELRREVDPSVEWLSRGDVRNELGSEAFHGAVLSRKSAMMHMGRYANGMAEAAARHGATIWEHNPVRSCIRVSDGWRITSPT